MWLWLYLLLYLFISAMGMREDVNDGEPRWYLALGGATFVIGGAGILVAAADWTTPEIRAIWQFLAPVFTVAIVYELFHDLKSLFGRQDPELSETESAGILAVGTVLAFVALLPALVINLRIGFS